MLKTHGSCLTLSKISPEKLWHRVRMETRPSPAPVPPGVPTVPGGLSQALQLPPELTGK